MNNSQKSTLRSVRRQPLRDAITHLEEYHDHLSNEGDDPSAVADTIHSLEDELEEKVSDIPHPHTAQADGDPSEGYKDADFTGTEKQYEAAKAALEEFFEDGPGRVYPGLAAHWLGAETGLGRESVNAVIYQECDFEYSDNNQVIIELS